MVIGMVVIVASIILASLFTLWELTTEMDNMPWKF